MKPKTATIDIPQYITDTQDAIASVLGTPASLKALSQAQRQELGRLIDMGEKIKAFLAQSSAYPMTMTGD